MASSNFQKRKVARGIVANVGLAANMVAALIGALQDKLNPFTSRVFSLVGLTVSHHTAPPNPSQKLSPLELI
jgi:hypothetical protein